MEFEARGRTTRRRALAALAWAGVGMPGAARAAHTLKPWPADRPAPPLDLTDLDGRTWDLPALAGRVVVLNFWASWCAPCRAEMPTLERLRTRHPDSRLVILAVNYKETAAEIRRYLDPRRVALPILLDRDGDAASAWTPRVFPTTVLIDRSGRPRSSVLGELDWSGADAAALIEPLLAKPKTA